MLSDDARQSATVGALRFWWLMVGTISAISTLGFRLSMQAANSSGITAIGLLVASVVVGWLICVLQCSVLRAYISNEADKELARDTRAGWGLALLIIGPSMLTFLVFAAFVPSSSFGSAEAGEPGVPSMGTVFSVMEIVLGVAGACIVAVSQGLVLRQHVEDASWRRWVRTSAFAGLIIMVLYVSIGVAFTGWGWLVSAPWVAVMSGICAVSALPWLVRK